MLQAMAELWRLAPPGPDNLLAAPAFDRLREACRDGYPNAGKKGPTFALSTALRSLGLPCELRADAAHLASPVETAAIGLDTALRATHARRLHLAPLDLAEEIPPLAFGPARVARFKADELRALVDTTRLKRMFQGAGFDADRFSEFHWLVVEEDVVLDKEPEARAVPVLFMDMREDFGRIEPHKGRFPSALEGSLFFFLLAPWESWSTMPEVDWRGFRVPWVYTVDSDIFVRPSSPPSADTLNWEDRVYDDGYGGTVEVERPLELRLSDEAKTEVTVWDQHRWAMVEQAKRTVLFETPIAHFLVRAFLAEGVDEFLAHITTIEAALGLQSDYQKNLRISSDRHKGMRATNRMRGRVAGLLGERRYADQYETLFNVRSAFLHGRAMNAISTGERVLARSLARQVVEALILATQTGTISSREDFLDDLLDKGAPMIRATGGAPS
ncbi:hypothetical protein LH128_08626 [Sphingomonas sp. LH128]|nr:hypothetical protein LH128_08626 [Sphingomonas sp. LH128]